MATIRVKGATLHYDEQEQGTVAIVLAHGLIFGIDQIALPTLITVGDQAGATVPAKAERMHARIPNSRLVTIPGAGHTSTVEEPAAVTEAIESFLAELPQVAT